ncbi:LytTR family DNA-binding domain-containing protein [Sandarakinorhabdus sp.]|uniref:LytTR family DNA-binding domain-containing protein n=1 Tax=Sandarakinorhabdus sp. TaxID=1916663 RepID=UPI00286E5E4E|nr:LytTR family DNA-binding domain-containing protein [Sandarakinorhabdus sp.]
MSGTETGTGGQALRWAALLVTVMMFAKAVVDALSLADGDPTVPASRFLALELTSAGFFAAMLLPIWLVSRRLRPPHLSWPQSLAAHLALSIPLVMSHAAWLGATRTAVFALMGNQYRFDWSWGQLLFEWRKDALSLLALASLGWTLDRLFGPAKAAQPTPAPFRLAVKDGARTRMIAADEISHASSAGNYVEIATDHGCLLHRVTLAALAEELAPHGFVRIHRAHLVRSGAVREVVSEGSGDFAVTMAHGLVLPGSRRWRSALTRMAT